MDDTALDVVITLVRGGNPVRVRLDKVLTTVGSDEAADVRVEGLPARWAVIQREGDGARVRLLGGRDAQLLRVGTPLSVDGAEVSLEQAASTAHKGLPVQRIADALCAVESPSEALRVLLRETIAAAGADSGAVVVSEGGSYAVAAAERRDGSPLDDPSGLLSDTIVRDVLAGRDRVLVPDARGTRYASVPSVVSLKLRSVLCVPMRLSGRIVGAIFLGAADVKHGFSERHGSDLDVLAAMAVPLLVQLRRVATRGAAPDDHLIGESGPMREVRAFIDRVAPSDLSVLVLGPTGTGKELVARAVHARSRRSARSLVALNCSAFPESLLNVELFGCKKGAFTGAIADRKGLIEEADGGTLFLDEVGDMPLAMQAALLRVLERREVIRLGENSPRAVDFRLVAATHKDLEAEVSAGRFREDLLFRLREFTLRLPPLAERGEDVVLLAQLFLRQAEAQLGLPLHRLGERATALLKRHAWPGNVRELRAAIRRAALVANESEITPEHFDLVPRPSASRPPPRDDEAMLGDLSRPLGEARDEFEQRYVDAVLARNGGNLEKAAASLGISVRSLYRRR